MSMEEQLEAWARPPVDDVGYVSSEFLLTVTDDELRGIIERMRVTRYTGGRNYGNKWRSLMGLDDPGGKVVLDFGCGVGVESLELALGGNDVIVADIVQSNVDLTERVLRLYGLSPAGTELVSWERPFLNLSEGSIDVLHLNGVLHHIPHAHDVIEESLRWLRADGVIRAMLYSDRGWSKHVGDPVPAYDSEVTEDGRFMDFVRVFDAVGFYADWYSLERLEWRFGDLVDVTSYSYITDDDKYCVATMVNK